MATTIKCLMHYDTFNNNENRTNHLAAHTKADYIFDCFKRLGLKVDLLSASGTKGKKRVKGRVEYLDNNFRLELLPAFGIGGKIKTRLSSLCLKIAILFKLLFQMEKNEILWVYHSLALIWPLIILKKIKKIKLIVEVEEIYGDVIGSKIALRNELRLFKYADGFIFPSYLLNEKINLNNKPSVISHGTYKAEWGRNIKFDDNRIHVAYAGTLDKRMGSLLAVEAAKFLSENYYMHILGGGTVEEIIALESKIKDVEKTTGCKIAYEGVLKGEEYISFISKCHIGLCPHYPDAQFNDTSFPSKILSYMSSGLEVISVKIPAIITSDIGKYIYYYDDQTAMSIANEIKKINIDREYDNRYIIDKLDEAFIKNLEAVIHSV